MLFYDFIFFVNNECFCVFCYYLDKVFIDGLFWSMAFNGEGNIQCNVLILINSVYVEYYFYDLWELNLECQVKYVVWDEKEFNIDFLEIVDKFK